MRRRPVLRRGAWERFTPGASPLPTHLQEEKWFGQACMMESFRGNIIRDISEWSGIDTEGASPEVLAVAVTIMRAQILIRGKRRILNDYTRFMDESIANARRPYVVHPPAPEMPDDPINQVILP